MINIAICDDDTRQQGLIEDFLDHYLLCNKDLQVKFKTFSSGKELINYILENGSFDLYLLDIVMPELNGIDVGKKIREMKDEGFIIYLTSEASFAVESYNTRAFHYLLKPIEKEKFFSVLDSVFQLLKSKASKYITVKTQDGITKISFDEINYAELTGRRIRYCLIDKSVIESVTLRNTFAEAVTPLLNDQRFVLCGASFAINLHQVSSIKSNNVYFKNNEMILPPKKNISTLRSQWLDFWLDGGM